MIGLTYLTRHKIQLLNFRFGVAVSSSDIVKNPNGMKLVKNSSKVRIIMDRGGMRGDKLC